MMETRLLFNIPGLHPLIGKNISIRVLGVDTPEIRTKNFCEKKKAVVAKKKVYDMLKKARNIELHNIKRGKYFRIVSDVIVDGKSIGKELIKSRLAYPYYGGSKKISIGVSREACFPTTDSSFEIPV